ncbi:MAG: DedA family protein [Simkania sp.]|nr:DedA family protein [Simkania sp.]
METLTQWILTHAEYAHWIIFFGILLAGFNIPISADLLVIAAAMLAATIVPDNLWLLYGSVFFGCLLSAHIAYWIGRLVGPQLLKWQFFSRFLPAARLNKIQTFYDKYGLLTLIIGRFIPLGVRNAIFMTTGMSKVSFRKFAIRDILACFIWTGVSFSCFYVLGHNYAIIKQFLYTFQIALFLAFGVTVIGFIWYKKRKATTTESSPQ